MTPKFSVGEVVILQSVRLPELNGECTVSVVIPPDAFYPCLVTGKSIRNASGYVCYLIYEKHHMTRCVSGNMTTGMWAESSLRKKHQPGELSYAELLESLTVKSGAPA